MHFERNLVFWLAALAVFVALLWLLSPILLPFVLGMAIAYVLDPLAERLTRRGMSRLIAALTILGAFVLFFAVLFVLIAPVLAHQFVGLIKEAPSYVQRLQAFVRDPNNPWLKQFIGDNLAGSDKPVGDLLDQASGYLTGLAASVWERGRALFSILSLIVITPVVAFYLICDWDDMVAAIDRLIPLPQRDTVRGLFTDIDKTISAYVRGQSAVCVILGTYYALGLTVVGLSYGLLIGVVSGLISFIPYVGSLTALVLSLAVATAQFFPDWSSILIVAGVVLLGQFLEGNVLSPYLVGHSVGLHPVWLMLALIAFGYLFGFVGLLLAVPLAAAAGVLIRFAVRRYRASALYTGAAPSSPIGFSIGSSEPPPGS
jgi:predicted PurR-regulated permease PerM